MELEELNKQASAAQQHTTSTHEKQPGGGSNEHLSGTGNIKSTACGSRLSGWGGKTKGDEASEGTICFDESGAAAVVGRRANWTFGSIFVVRRHKPSAAEPV